MAGYRIWRRRGYGRQKSVLFALGLSSPWPSTMRRRRRREDREIDRRIERLVWCEDQAVEARTRWAQLSRIIRQECQELEPDVPEVAYLRQGPRLGSDA